MVRERLAGHLRSLSFDPAKGEKARLAAAKLGIDLTVHAVHTLMAKEM
jgi:hypothetical protein